MLAGADDVLPIPRSVSDDGSSRLVPPALSCCHPTAFPGVTSALKSGHTLGKYRQSPRGWDNLGIGWIAAVNPSTRTWHGSTCLWYWNLAIGTSPPLLTLV